MYHQITRALIAACVLVVFSSKVHAFSITWIPPEGPNHFTVCSNNHGLCFSKTIQGSNCRYGGAESHHYCKMPVGQSCQTKGLFDDGSGFCVEEPEPECGVDDGKSPAQCDCESNGASWVTGLEICGVNPDENNPNERDGCEANGGTFGLFNNETVCLPADFGVPTCSSAGNVASYSDSNGGDGWACESDTSGNSDQPDTDNDGIPDIADSDIDNDGIPNASDDDVNGDGVLNTSDPSYQGESFDNSLTESKLDLIHDTLKNLKTDLTEQVPDSKSDNITNDALSTGQSELDSLFDSALSDDSNLAVTIQESEITLGDEINSIFPDFACVSYNQPVFQGYGFNITCDSTNRLRDLLSWVFYMFTAWYLFSLITTPVNKD